MTAGGVGALAAVVLVVIGVLRSPPPTPAPGPTPPDLTIEHRGAERSEGGPQPDEPGGGEGGEGDARVEGAERIEGADEAAMLAGVPSAPLAPRAHAHAAWTGEELLVWSGALVVEVDSGPAVGPEGHFEVADDGAAYNPRTGRWRELPDAPIPGRVDAAAVWADGRFVVWGGFAGPDEPLDDGAVYDPDADTWELLPPAPISARGQMVAAWTGRQAIFAGGTQVAGAGPPARAATARDGATYDPATGSWTALPPMPASVWPLPGRFAGAWTGDGLVVWGRDVAVYRPGARDWEHIRSPRTGHWPGVPVQAAALREGIVVFGLVARQAPSVYGLAYGLENGVGDGFELLPPLERSSMTSRQRGVVAAGERVVVLLGPPASEALAWRPGADSWDRVPAGLGERDGAALAWTGRALLVWGGWDGSTLRADGISWTP